MSFMSRTPPPFFLTRDGLRRFRAANDAQHKTRRQEEYGADATTRPPRQPRFGEEQNDVRRSDSTVGQIISVIITPTARAGAKAKV